MRRPWPISQLRPPDTPGLIKKAPDNGITGQINDPLMKSLTKQAKTARPTYVFHHAVALTFPLTQPPRQAQLGRGRRRKREAEPPLTHTDSSRIRSLAGAKKGSTGPYAAEAAHLVAQPIMCPIPGASPSIFVSVGQIEKAREREKLSMTE
ncbi:hypothetical protein Q8A73_008654 [Channa argus]|nr:hypothetical protein Q8A73_008654 [Channa argus]